MSNEAITWAYRDVKGIGLTAKAVLVRLADQANSDGIAWPGKCSLAEVLDCDKRTVDRAIEKLIAMGLISVQREKNDAGRNETNVYCLHLKQPELFDENAAPRVAERRGWQSATHGTAPGGRVAESHGEGGTAPPEPSVNPQLEPRAGTRKPRERGQRLPAGWQPSEELRAWAMTERPGLDLQQVLDSFTDYWIAKTGASACKLDWDATFRNWVRNEKREHDRKESPAAARERRNRAAYARAASP